MSPGLQVETLAASTPLCLVKELGQGYVKALGGIVRLTGLELTDQKWSRLSRGELTPFSERGSAVLLEAIAAV